MAFIPAFCTNCQSLFASRLFVLDGDVKGLTLEGNQEPCPKCNSMAHVVDGSFDVTNGMLKMISGPELTADIMQRFGYIADLAIRNEITPQLFEERAAEITPALGELAKKINSAPSKLTVLILLMFYLKSCNFSVDAKVDLNQLFNQLANHSSAQSVGNSSPELPIPKAK